MIYRLTTVSPGVDHRSIAGLSDSFLSRESSGETHHPAEQIGIDHIVQRRDVFFGDDQNVRRSLGSDVAEGDDFLVVHDRLRRYFAAHDLAENAILGISHWPVSRLPSMPRRWRPLRRPRSQNVACSGQASQGETLHR